MWSNFVCEYVEVFHNHVLPHLLTQTENLIKYGCYNNSVTTYYFGEIKFAHVFGGSGVVLVLGLDEDGETRNKRALK